jgi:hypothetical protein
MCNNCIHKPVCGKFLAIGGHVRECEHFKEEKHGRWLNWQGEPIEPDEYWRCWRCSECTTEFEFPEAVDADEFASKYCPNCGAKMDGGTDNG